VTHATERTRRSTPPRVPDGYGLVEATRRRALVWHEASSWAEERLRSDATLLDWAAQEPARSEMRGRGNVYVVPAPAQGPDGRDRWVVRHYHRGGAMAAHMEDRYLRLGRLRPWRELAAVAEARARGVPTPAVVCGAAYLGLGAGPRLSLEPRLWSTFSRKRVSCMSTSTPTTSCCAKERPRGSWTWTVPASSRHRREEPLTA
jgi:hypothetical protein